MKKIIGLSFLILFLSEGIYGQTDITIPVPGNLEPGYPRIYITQAEKGDLEKTIRQE